MCLSDLQNVCKPTKSVQCSAGHVPTFFLKLFRSVLEQGPLARSFRFRLFFFNRSIHIPFCSALGVLMLRTLHSVPLTLCS